MSKATLVIMAAGMGSRYGGLKQIDPITESGEIILDFSVYDAIRAGFERVIFVIKKEIEADFKEVIKDKFTDVDIDFAFQDLHDLPEGFTCPEGRIKPWGTGHAVLACRDMIDGPFAVINADDYYGPETFRLIYDEITKEKAPSGKYEFCMAGFMVENTLTENGHVARGVCQCSDDGYLTDIVERTKIAIRDGKIMFTEDEEAWTEIPQGSTVSMNCWGFTEDILRELDCRFPHFLKANLDTNPLKCEFFLPFVVDDLLKEGKATVKVLPSPEKWYGVTYKEDKPSVSSALRQKVTDGIYPSKLW